MWGRRHNKNPSFFTWFVEIAFMLYQCTSHLPLSFRWFSFLGPLWKSLAKLWCQSLRCVEYWERSWNLESVPLHFSHLSREPRSPHQAPPASEPQGMKESCLSSLWETNQEPLAGGRTSLLTHAQPCLGALLLAEKLILGICTELFIVKAALIPRVSKSPWKKN